MHGPQGLTIPARTSALMARRKGAERLDNGKVAATQLVKLTARLPGFVGP